MDRLKKEKSISRIFIIYIISFLVFIPLEVCVLGLAFVVSFDIGFIKPANYYEQIVEKNRTKIESVDINEIQELIPDKCIYAVYSTNGDLIKSNVNEEYNTKLWDVIKGNQVSGNGYYYKVISRKDEVCIVGYTLSVFYSSDILNKILPNPEIFILIVFFIVFIIQIILFSKMFAKRISKEMKILKETTNNITMDNLVFDIKNSSISEVNEVLSALAKMKNELYKSLNEQWKKEDERRKQISYLAHDIKTPLTIIRGNSELLNECDLNEEEKEFNENILNETNVIEKYVLYAMDIMTCDKKTKINKENIKIKDFIKEIEDMSTFLCRDKNIKFITKINENIQEFFNVDKCSLNRAIMNVISNATLYSPKNTEIDLSIEEKDKNIVFTIEDSGCGFTKEEMIHGTDEFFRGDKSRSSRNNYGMGLYISKTFIENHGGNITLENSRELKGAKVTITIPK